MFLLSKPIVLQALFPHEKSFAWQYCDTMSDYTLQFIINIHRSHPATRRSFSLSLSGHNAVRQNKPIHAPQSNDTTPGRAPAKMRRPGLTLPHWPQRCVLHNPVFCETSGTACKSPIVARVHKKNHYSSSLRSAKYTSNTRQASS